MFLNLSEPTTADAEQPKLTDFRFPGVPKLTFRFSLGSLMIVVTLAAAVLGGAVAYRNWRNELPPGGVAEFSMRGCRRAVAKGRPVLVLQVWPGFSRRPRDNSLEAWFDNEEVRDAIRKRNGVVLLLDFVDEQALDFHRQLERNERGLASLTIVLDRNWRHVSIEREDRPEAAEETLAALR